MSRPCLKLKARPAGVQPSRGVKLFLSLRHPGCKQPAATPIVQKNLVDMLRTRLGANRGKRWPLGTSKAGRADRRWFFRGTAAIMVENGQAGRRKNEREAAREPVRGFVPFRKGQ